MKSKRKMIWLLLMIGVMIVIFCLSNQPSEVSSKISDTVAEGMNIQQENTSTSLSATKVAFGLNIRKLAHIGLFALLGITARGYTTEAFRALAICFGYAVFDETHQFFVEGRTGSVKDVAIDAIGFLLVIFVWEIIAIIMRNRKKKA